MTNHRGTAKAVGILFVFATVPFSISVVMLEPILGAPDFLERVAGSPGRVAFASLLEVTNHIAVVAIAVLIYPVLTPFGERLALGYVVARSIESVLFLTATMHLLALVEVSGVVGADPLATLLHAGHDWNRVPFAFTAFGMGSLLLNYTLLRARLVPRWIAGFGLLAASAILAARLLQLAGVELSPSTVTAMDGPIFVQEMVFAAWLILRGFNPTALAEAQDKGAMSTEGSL
jgi:hypothetical protein